MSDDGDPRSGGRRLLSRPGFWVLLTLVATPVIAVLGWYALGLANFLYRGGYDWPPDPPVPASASVLATDRAGTTTTPCAPRCWWWTSAA